MFAREDYVNYFEELESMLKKTLVVYTDLFNELGNEAMKSKLFAMSAESMEAFRFIKDKKEKF